jgi:galactonate dehydratase
MSEQLAALRQGTGPDIGLMIDLNLHVHPEGLRRVAKTIAPHDMTWLEYDLYDPVAMARLRNQIDVPLASYECLFGRRGFRPFLEAGAADVAIIDIIWNGLNESLKIAAMADSFGVDVAPHNYYSPLASAISGHFSAAIPNFSIMETDVDGVPWHNDIVSPALKVENGCLILPEGPGWGVEVNEDVVRSHPLPGGR